MSKQTMEFFKYNRKTKLALLVLLMAYFMFLGSVILVLTGVAPEGVGELPHMFFSADNLLVTVLSVLGIFSTTNVLSKFSKNGNGQSHGRDTSGEGLE